MEHGRFGKTAWGGENGGKKKKNNKTIESMNVERGRGSLGKHCC
jgi:hypothetical protein